MHQVYIVRSLPYNHGDHNIDIPGITDSALNISSYTEVSTIVCLSDPKLTKHKFISAALY